MSPTLPAEEQIMVQTNRYLRPVPPNEPYRMVLGKYSPIYLTIRPQVRTWRGEIYMFAHIDRSLHDSEASRGVCCPAQYRISRHRCRNRHLGLAYWTTDSFLSRVRRQNFSVQPSKSSWRNNFTDFKTINLHRKNERVGSLMIARLNRVSDEAVVGKPSDISSDSLNNLKH